MLNIYMLNVFLFTAFHYPELNTSHHLRFTWVRTGENTPLLVLLKPSFCETRFHVFVSVLCQSCWEYRSSRWLREALKLVWRDVWLCCWRRDCRRPAGGAGGEPQLWETAVCRYTHSIHNTNGCMHSTNVNTTQTAIHTVCKRLLSCAH